MSTTDADPPTNDPLRVGLIADAEGVAWLAEAVKSGPLQVVAQAGMRQPEALPDVDWYDDTRAMIVQSGIEAVLLATSVRAGVQLGKIALERGVHVWRTPPLARNFAEAVETVRAAERPRVVYRVASWWDHIAADVRWACEQCGEGFQPRFTELRVATAGPPVQSWRASTAEAGGGVLATGAYDLLDTLVALRGLPESTSAVVGRYRRRAGEAPRETEDVAAAILRYDGGGAATVQAAWDIPPFESFARHHGVEAGLVLNAEGVTTHPADGQAQHTRRFVADRHAAEIVRFAAAIRAGDSRPASDPALERHLAISALLEAIYLAARTVQPETPGRLYEVQGWRAPRR